MIDSLRVKPDLMKVDVEGYEARVFRGAERLLTNGNPPALCFEWNPLTSSEVGSCATELMASLANYAFYYIDDFEGQRRPFGTPIGEPALIDWVCNLFAVPNAAEALHRWSKLSQSIGRRAFF
jgi:hypothetical protein